MCMGARLQVAPDGSWRRKLASVVAENCMDAPAGDICCGVQYAGQGSVCKEDFLLAKQLKQLEAADGNRWQ